jgi:hypothetical protein
VAAAAEEYSPVVAAAAELALVVAMEAMEVLQTTPVALAAAHPKVLVVAVVGAQAAPFLAVPYPLLEVVAAMLLH